MELVRQFLRQNFGEIAVQQGEEIMMRLFEHQKQVGEAQFRSTIHSACQQIAQNMDYSQRLQLLNFLVMIAQADGSVHQKEIEAIKEVGNSLHNKREGTRGIWQAEERWRYALAFVAYRRTTHGSHSLLCQDGSKGIEDRLHGS